MKKISRLLTSKTTGARLIVALIALVAIASVFTTTAQMQGKLNNDSKAVEAMPAQEIAVEAKPARAESAEQPSRSLIGETITELKNSAGAPGLFRSPGDNSPTVAGTCETAGPVEVESSGGTAAGVPTAYATLAAAFTAINGGTLHLGTITIDVCGNTTETGTAGLNQVAGVTSVTMSPAGGAARTISGAIAAGSPLINLNGADNVTIDGLNTGGNSLTISNTTIGTTAGTGTIRFIADASNNTVTNCSILGSSTSTLATVAGTIIFSTGTTTGNDNNTISNNNIGPAGANLPSKAIMASGTSSTIENDNAMITGNNIFDYFIPTTAHTGINIITGNEGWTISNNKFYQTAPRTVTTAATRHSAITLNNSTGTFTVSGNTIGFASAAGTGTYTISGTTNEFRGIDAPSVNTTPATSIQNNTISGISQSSSRASTTLGNSAFIGITIGETGGLFNVGTTTGNTIGSLDASSSIVVAQGSTTANTAPFIGIYDFSFANSNLSNNKVGTITINNGGTGTTFGFRGILINGTSGQSVTVNNNIIGGTAAGSITDNIVGSYGMYGIQNTATTTSANLSATGNVIRNMSGNSTGASLIISSGILFSPTSASANTISQNTIHSLSNASGAAANSIYGMSLSLPTAANVIERNLIHSFSLTSTVTGTQIWGINGGTTGTATYKNNMIRLGLTAAGASVTLPTSMIGIRDAAGSTNQFFHNSIYIGGTGVLATPTASNSYCFFSDVVTVTRAFQDNIFWNARSNAVGGGVAHLAIRVGGTAANPAGLTSNYNDLYFSGTDGATGVFNAVVIPNLAAWRTATGQDANSFAGDPQFIAPNGTAATVDLHIHPTNPTPIEAAGLAIGTVTDDYDGQTRSALTPTDIGADAGNFVALDISPPNISYTPFANTASTANRTLAVTIADATGVNSGANTPRIYFKKSTDAAYVSTQCTMTGGTAQNGTYNCTIDYSLVGGGSVVANDIIQYFVVAQDTTGNLASNPGGATGANVNTVTFSGTPNSYTIVPSISGNKTVGTGGDYATLTAAFAAVNGAEISGPVTLTLTDATYPSETFPLTLNANGGASSTNTVTIKPTTGVSPAISGSSASCIMTLNGADYVTIDGSNAVGGASRDLTVTNTNTGTSSAGICLLSTGVNAGATNNTVKNTNVVGASITGTDRTLAGIFSGTSTISITSAGADNDSNTIQNNNVTKTQYGIYTGGASAANKNTGTVITQNVMNSASPNNITTGGILANFEDGIQITQNDISVLKHDGTTGTTGTAFGIALGLVPNNTVTTFTGSDVTNASVLRNRINGVTQLNSTGYSTFGIVVNSVTSGTTLLANNMVSGVRSPSTASDFSAGIVAGGGTGSTTQIYFNSVSMTGARGAGATFPSYGLAINSGNPVVDVKNNIFFNTQTSGSTGKSYAIANASTTFTNMTSNNNDLFVTGASGFVGQTGGLGTAGTDRLTLANWQTATGQDANSLSVDPLFVSTTDLHLQAASTVRNAGTPIATVTTDFDGETRSATTPDIGADETAFAGSLQLSSATYSVGEGAGNIVINVTRTGGNDGAASVHYATADGTAGSADYTAQTGTLNWTDGDAANKTITVSINDDSIYEGDETFSVNLDTATGATLGTPSTATVTINDNDSAPTLSVSDFTFSGGDARPQVVSGFVVTLTGATELPVTVHYATSDNTALAGSDYTAASGTLTFNPGETSMNVPITILGDSINEPTETFFFDLDTPTNATISDGHAVGTIVDDDAQPSLSIDDVTMNEGDASTTNFTFTVTKTGSTTQTVTVDFTTVDGTATIADNDYQANSGTLTFLPAETTKTITVLVNGDTNVEPTEDFTVHLSNESNATIANADGTGTITNDDVAPLSGTKTVCASGCDYTSLTGAAPGGLFAAVNSSTVSDNLIISIGSDLTEDGTNALNQWTESGMGGYTMTIQPADGTMKTISGNVPAGLIRLNGADRVTIDGRFGGTGRFLTFRSTHINAATITLLNDASDNTIRSSVIEGRARISGATPNGVIYISTGTTTGNDNNTITDNQVRNRSDVPNSVPLTLITSFGTSSAIANSGGTISDNELFNFDFRAINVSSGNSGNESWTVSGNTVHQTLAARPGFLNGISVTSGGTNIITQNTVRDLNADFGMYAILVGGSAGTTTVSQNRVYSLESSMSSNHLPPPNDVTVFIAGIVSFADGSLAVTIVNNQISIAPSSANDQTLIGIADQGTSGTSYNAYFNSVLVGGTATGTGSTWACLRTDETDPGVPTASAHTSRDNICFNNRTGGTGNHFAAGDQSAAGSYSSDYNLFVGTGATAANFFDYGTSATGTPVSFAQWQASTGGDANSLASNPGGNYTVANMFVSGTDLHLNTAGTNPASNAGTPVVGITTDFDGATRDPSTPDIGADEVASPITLQVSAATYSVGEGGGNATITVTRAGGSSGAVSVGYTTNDGTATAGDDYTLTSGTLNWSNGDAASKSFNIPIADDSTYEGDEDFTVTLSAPTGGATLGTPSTTTVTINDNDSAPAFSIDNVTHNEGNAGTTSFTFNVTKTGATALDAAVSFTTLNGTALSGTDYSVNSNSLTFMPAETSKQITVTVNGDAVIEGNETFFVNLSSPTDASIADAQGLGTIDNDDGPTGRLAFAKFDFDGDSKTDIAVWDGTSGNWYVVNSNGGAQVVQYDWGRSSLGDMAVPADYDGDGKVDFAVFRPSEGNWYIIESLTGVPVIRNWGQTGDVPVPGDFDGDNKTDVAVFRPSEGNWYIKNSRDNTATLRGWGDASDQPVLGDFDGDRMTDIAIYRPTEGNWYIINSATNTVTLQNWGVGGDRPVPGDYDGDGKTDIAVFRAAGDWYIRRSGGGVTIKNWGNADDKTVAGDYDGDSKTDIAVWRPSEGTWYIINSATNTASNFYLGNSGDVPVPGAFVP